MINYPTIRGRNKPVKPVDDAVKRGKILNCVRKRRRNGGKIAFSANIPTQSSNSKRKNRKRDIIWYNPLFSKNVSTNIGRTFLNLLDAEACVT